MYEKLLYGFAMWAGQWLVGTILKRLFACFR